MCEKSILLASGLDGNWIELAGGGRGVICWCFFEVGKCVSVGLGNELGFEVCRGEYSESRRLTTGVLAG